MELLISKSLTQSLLKSCSKIFTTHLKSQVLSQNNCQEGFDECWISFILNISHILIDKSTFAQAYDFLGKSLAFTPLKIQNRKKIQERMLVCKYLKKYFWKYKYTNSWVNSRAKFFQRNTLWEFYREYSDCIFMYKVLFMQVLKSI